LPPQADADPISRLTGSTASFGPNIPLVSGSVEARTRSASRTFFLARRVPVRNFEIPGGAWLLYSDRVLQNVNGFHILGIGRIDQRADCRYEITSADIVLGNV